MRRTSAAALVTLLAVLPLAASETIPLWPKGAPGAKGKGPNDVPSLKMYPKPAEAGERAPAVLLIPGGGYKHVSGYAPYRKFFAVRPVRFFSLKYRLPVHGYRHPAPLQDAQRAVAMMRANAEKWGLDPKKILVVGFSSGGHVASTLATHFEEGDPKATDPIWRFSSRPDFLALFCPVVTMKGPAHQPSVNRLLGPSPSDELVRDLSNQLQVTANTPPTFLGHAIDDKLVLVENSTLFHEALKEVGVPSLLKVYRNGGHNVVAKPNPWRADLGDWLITSAFLPEGSVTPTPESAGVYEPRSNYTEKTLVGSKVIIHNSLLEGGEHAEVGAKAIQNLIEAMKRLKAWMPADRWADFLKVTHWLEWNSTRGPWGPTSAYQYHPGRDWLTDMDFHPGKHKCVEWGNALSLSKRNADATVTVLLHELAHAYHDQFLTFDHEEIWAAYHRCVNGTAYPERDWVKADHKEFFAGVTTRYFGRKDERDAVVQRDPVLAKELRKIWGTPRKTIDNDGLSPKGK